MSYCRDCDWGGEYHEARGAGFSGHLRCPSCGSYDVIE